MIEIVDHLWQSTLFAAITALIAWVLRRQRASVRYWLWFVASVKFLVPFSMLVSLGSVIGSQPVVQPIRPDWRMVAYQAAPAITLANPVATVERTLPQPSPAWPIVLAGVWLVGVVAVAGLFFVRGLRIHRAVRNARFVAFHCGIPVLVSDALIEPGVCGFIRPKVILPDGIESRLSPEQMKAVLAHEMCHVRRRDNLFGLLQMAIEALVWFHPLVWWIGARLLDERETACDEEVLTLGNKPEAYAEGILNVCKFYLESPVACAPGVSGSDLRKRIESIMKNAVLQNMTTTRKLLLAATAASAILIPVVIGVAHAPRAFAQSASGTALTFDVASVKPSNPDGRNVMIHLTPGGGVNVTNTPLKVLIGIAYDIRPFQISGGPDWIGTERFDIQGKVDGGESQPDLFRMNDADRRKTEKAMQERLRSLLAERFQLVTRKETKEMPAYVLTVAKGGHKLKPAPDNVTGPHGMRMQRGRVEATSSTLEMVTRAISNELGRPVLDQTGLTGKFDFTLEWTPEMGGGGLLGGGDGPGGAPPASTDSSGPSIFTALQEQLGLKLESRKAPVEIVVIERVEKPSAN